jgi:hypothetical protein
MNTTQDLTRGTAELTRHAHKRLITFLEDQGNIISIPHSIALRTLCEAFFSMGHGEITGRWAVGLPTGTGKTTAAIECMATLHRIGDDTMSVVVSAGRVRALWAMKRGLLDAGVPEHKIGLLYVDGANTKDEKGHRLPGYFPPTAENDQRQFLLISHARTANSTHLEQFNTYRGAPRSVMVYDESLLVSEISHFNVHELVGTLGGAVATLELDVRTKPELAHLVSWLKDRHHAVSSVYTGYHAGSQNDLPEPAYTLSAEEQVEYQQHFKAELNTLLSEFIAISHLPLRMVRGLKTAAITYQISVPHELRNMLVLDASYAIRMLEHEGVTLQNAENLPSCKRLGVMFDEIKSFEHVTIKRMARHGGRNSMANKSAQGKMKNSLLDAVKVIEGIAPDEKVLVFVYKDRDNVNPGKYLTTCLKSAGLYDPKRIFVETWGNETSSNDFRECQHVLLIGILHREETELHAQYLGERDNLALILSDEKVKQISLSERAHLAYQALSRGACRVMGDGGKANKMTGYVIEVEAALEVELSKVMPAVKWDRWDAVHSSQTAHGQLVGDLYSQICEQLSQTKAETVTIRSLKKAVGRSATTFTTWQKALKRALDQNPQWIQSGQRLNRAS